MNKELIMKSDVLDILFENRNKNYGAYQLRKFYGNRLLKAMGLMMGAVVVLSAFTFLPKKKVMYTAEVYEIPDNKRVILKEPDKKPDPAKVPAKPQASQRLINNIVIVPNTSRTDSIRDLKPNIAISNVTTTLPNNFTELIIESLTKTFNTVNNGSNITPSTFNVSNPTNPSISN